MILLGSTGLSEVCSTGGQDDAHVLLQVTPPEIVHFGPIQLRCRHPAPETFDPAFQSGPLIRNRKPQTFAKHEAFLICEALSDRGQRRAALLPPGIGNRVSDVLVITSPSTV